MLKLGDINIDDSNFDESQTPCSILNVQDFQEICALLGCDFKALSESFLFKRREVAKQIISSPQRKNEVMSQIDSFAKILYDSLFQWLVDRLNKSIHIRSDQQHNFQVLSIGLLDIFGFENFPQNSFEQLCINYTNEHLQQLYLTYVFKNEQEEFAK